MEEKKEAQEERTQLKAHFKQSAEAAAATFGCGAKMEQRRENAAAVKKKDDKRYRENAKENRKTKAEAAQAEDQVFDRNQRRLVEGQEGLLEALNFTARPTTTKTATDGKFVKATVNGYFVTMQEAGQGTSDEAEAAWVEREAEVASVKAMMAEVARAVDDLQRDAFGIPPEGHRRLDEERRCVEEWNAGIRKDMQEEDGAELGNSSRWDLFGG